MLDESGAKTKKLSIVRPQKAKDMENKLHDAEFKKTEEYADFEKKYVKIIENWGKKIKKQTQLVKYEKQGSGILFNFPNANGLPGFIANLQKFIFPKSLNTSIILSVSLEEIPPVVTIISHNSVEDFKPFFTES